MKDFFKIAVNSIVDRKLRSILTVLGIIISIASIVTLISLSNGLTNAIEEQFEKIGSNRIFIMAQGDTTGAKTSLTEDDIDTLEKLGYYEYIVPYLVEPATETVFSKETQYVKVVAFPTENVDQLLEDYDFQYQEGRGFREDEKFGVMIGSIIADDVFKKNMHARNSITINEQKFEITGILESVGNSEDDSTIWMPLEAARELFDKPVEVTFIDATVKKGVDLQFVKERSERALERARGNENFSILTPEQILKFLDTTLGIVQGILVAIAAISLIVGAVGIMNTMYTSVLERTKEIGVMKSIGATNNSILTIFMIEAGIIGLIGGLIGALLGSGISFMIEQAAAAGGFAILKIEFDFVLILGVLIFSSLIGMVSGALPARQASKLHPVDALRWTK